MISIVLALALQPVGTETKAPSEKPLIIVNAPTLESLAAAVQACIDARCPVRQDVDASVRYANALFAAGDYRAAKNVLTRAQSRVDGRAGEDAPAVSQLNRAISVVAEHYGDRRQQRRAAAESVRVLEEHDADTGLILRAKLSQIASDAATTDGLATERRYSSLIEQARAANNGTIVAEAKLLKALIARARGASAEAETLVSEAIAQPGISPQLRQSGKIALARWAQADGQVDMETAVASVGIDSSGTGTTAVTAPAIRPPTDGARIMAAEMGFDATTRSSDVVSLGWADVGFDIADDGTVGNVRVIKSGGRSTRWLASTLASIAGRRYPVGDGSIQRSRVERYTLTADFDTPLGSLIKRRLRNHRVERIDFTPS